TNNILSPANGKPIIGPTQDIVLGLYYMTRGRPFSRGHGRIFSSPNEVLIAYESGSVELQAEVKVRVEGKMYDTTIGRVLFYDVFPEKFGFEYANKVMTNKELGNLIYDCFRFCDDKATVILSDRLKDLGYRFATIAGISIAMADMTIPASKEESLRA